MSRIRAPVAGLSSVTQPAPLLRNFESVTHTWFPAEATAPPGSLSADGGLERVMTSGPVAATSMTEPCGREPSADLAPTLMTSQAAVPVMANGTSGRDMTRIRAPAAVLHARLRRTRALGWLLASQDRRWALR